MNFDRKTYDLKISLIDVKIAGAVKIATMYRKVVQSTISVNISPGKLFQFDVCDPAYDTKTGQFPSTIDTKSGSFKIKVCSKDIYGNPKPYTDDKNNLIKIIYPSGITSPEQAAKPTVSTNTNTNNTQFSVTIPLVGNGKYGIYNSKFFNGDIKRFEITDGSAYGPPKTVTSNSPLQLSVTDIVPPVIYKTGDPLTIALVIKDTDKNCMIDAVDSSKFSLVVSTPDNSQDLFNSFSFKRKTIDFNYCKSYYEATNTTEVNLPEGTYYLAFLKDSMPQANTKMFVNHNEISPSKTQITINGTSTMTQNMVVGVAQQIKFVPQDDFNNKFSYEGLGKTIEIKVGNLTIYTDYMFSVTSNDGSVLINLVVYKIGTYPVQFLIGGVEFKNLNGLSKVVVTSGPCSTLNPSLTSSEQIVYTGSHSSIEIRCMDNYNNTVDSSLAANFNLNIKGRDLEIVSEDIIPYILTNNRGVYTAQFLLAYSGNYTASVFLNGVAYSKPINYTVIPRTCPVDKAVMCSNRTCVKSASECTEDVGKGFTSPTMPFSCQVNGTDSFVASLSECDCDKGLVKKNGMCVPSSLNSYFDSLQKTTCQVKDGVNTTNLTKCFDGSCRTNENCPNKFSCPIGYKSCGAECIRRGSICDLSKKTCSTDKVVCWDLSCADSIDRCPTGKTCIDKRSVVCADGKCVADSSLCIQPPKCTAPLSFMCPDFTCKNSADNCARKTVCLPGQALCEDNSCGYNCSSSITNCPSNKILCTTGECVANVLLCPTPMLCPTDKIKCPSGACTNFLYECEFTQSPNSLTCPPSLPLLCPDFSCVKNSTLCASPISCPPSTPFRCSNNECKADKTQCPSSVTCPKEFPVLCSDNTCQKASYHCKKNEAECKYLRCADGSCVKSAAMCPTQVICNSGLIKCWDGTCVPSISNCADPKYINCPDEMPFRCNDGSCRVDKQSCSTVSVCSSEKPVKCYDGSCRESLSLCPTFTSCGKNMRSCPDGTCTSDKCNTLVTCHPDTPYLCYDNSCRKDIRDCPEAPNCKGIVCPDGSCVDNRQQCKFFEPCSAKYPVRCSSGSCEMSATQCSSSPAECPIGYVRCQSGSCRSNEAFCDAFGCPRNLPYRCTEGTCVENSNYCNKENGCQFNTPIKCNDGSCVISSEKCPTAELPVCKDSGVRCTDGSCAAKLAECPLNNGCPANKSQKCADGTCIDPKLSQCKIPSCPIKYPIKCPSGNCVETTASCAKTPKIDDYKACQDLGFPGMYMCADGKCVPNAEHCLPIFTCPDNYFKCGDSTCRLSSALCPDFKSCPVNRPVRCSDLRCVKSNPECFSSIICPADFSIKCSTTGECVKTASDCMAKTVTANGCKEGFYKCLDGRCFSDKALCRTVDIACTETYPAICADGTCAAKVTDCSGKSNTCAGSGQIRCPDSKCVDPNQYWTSCLNKAGCPLLRPIRCTDGSCASKSQECPKVVSCPSSRPTLCADFTCQVDSQFCNVLEPCTGDASYRCDNGFCAKDSSACKAFSNFCPLNAPVKCPTGKCATDITECSTEYYQTPCEKEQIYCTALSICVNSINECVGTSNALGTKSGTSRRRILEEAVAPQNNCNSITPYSCYDGTCRAKANECPITPSCKRGEYRCSNGLCSRSASTCNKVTEKCSNDLIRCEDGLCRKICPVFDGCTLAKPYQCTNGLCTKNEVECIGLSMCDDFNAPFRCIDGTCAVKPENCQNIKRLYQSASTSVTVTSYSQTKLNFIFDSNSKSIGKLYIPASAININSNISNNITILYITPVAHSTFQDLSYYNNSDAIKYNVSNGISQSGGILSLDNSVLSPIFNISADNAETKLNHLASFYIEHDFYTDDKFFAEDYCLARFAENSWTCVDRKLSDDQIFFNFDSFGVYAVILNPQRVILVNNEETSSGLIVNNLEIIVIVVASIVFLAITTFYIFSRVIRYREKYKETKGTMANLQNQMEDYKNMSADIPGQTLGDNLAGIVYTRNPALNSSSVSKGSLNDLENEIEELQRKCKMIENQNKSIEGKIQDTNDQYKTLKGEIDRLKHNY